MTITDDNTITGQTVDECVGMMTELLGGLTASCRIEEAGAMAVLDQWIATLNARWPDGPPERVALRDYRAAFKEFLALAQSLITRAEGKP